MVLRSRSADSCSSVNSIAAAARKIGRNSIAEHTGCGKSRGEHNSDGRSYGDGCCGGTNGKNGRYPELPQEQWYKRKPRSSQRQWRASFS